jgi:hypothetical protein
MKDKNTQMKYACSLGGLDTELFEIIKVVSDKTIDIRMMKNGGLSNEPNKNGIEIRIRKSKKSVNGEETFQSSNGVLFFLTNDATCFGRTSNFELVF